MKKDMDWLNNELEKAIKAVESDDIYFAGKDDYDEGYIDGIRDVQPIINQLETEVPEVLSDKWIDDNSVYASSDGITEEYVHVDDLKELLVPKQELPTIPEFVEEFLIGKEDYMLYELLDDEWLYKEHNRVAKWLYDNDELTNKQREIDLVMARERGYTVEKEQKYYVEDSGGRTILAKMTYSHKGKTFDKVEPYNELVVGYKKELTEQEIKDYDERYWLFRKPVEELEE